MEKFEFSISRKRACRRRPVPESTRFSNRTPLSSCQLAVPETGLDPLGLSSAGLPVLYQGTTCAWTSIGQLGSSELGHWQAARSAPLVLWESQQPQRPSIEMRGEIGSGRSNPSSKRTLCESNRAGVPLVGNEETDKAQSHLAQTVRAKPAHGTESSREICLADSEQILPLARNRKPASDRAHWIQPVPY